MQEESHEHSAMRVRTRKWCPSFVAANKDRRIIDWVSFMASTSRFLTGENRCVARMAAFIGSGSSRCAWT